MLLSMKEKSQWNEKDTTIVNHTIFYSVEKQCILQCSIKINYFLVGYKGTLSFFSAQICTSLTVIMQALVSIYYHRK